MGRSGTSALAGVLALCGGRLPEALLGPSYANPRGHWEPWDALKLNDSFLAGHGATWFDPTLRLQGEVTFSDEQRASYIQEIQGFLRSLSTAPFAVIKDPRITALSDFWFEAARQMGFAIGVVIAIRHPEEVAGDDSQLLRSALSSQWYLERDSDVFNTRQDPYTHWLARGFHEGRLPCDDPLSLLAHPGANEPAWVAGAVSAARIRATQAGRAGLTRQAKNRLALRNTRIHPLYSPASRGRHEFCT